MKPSALVFCLFIALTRSSDLSDEDLFLEYNDACFVSSADSEEAWTEWGPAFEDPSSFVPTQMTLIKAIEKDDRETLLWHLDERLHIDCPVLSAKHAEQLNPLQYAVSLGKIALVRDIIMARGIHVNEQSAKSGSSALHFAIDSKYCDLSMVQTLIDAGADVDLLNFNGQSPVSMAIRLRDTSILELLLRLSSLGYTDQAGNTIANMAINYRAFDALSIILKRPGMNMNIRNSLGKAPIHNLIGRKCPINILQELLMYPGINKNLAETGTGYNALHLACKFNNDSVTNQLLCSNVNPFAVDQHGNLPGFFIPVENELMQLTIFEAEKKREAIDKAILILACPYQQHEGGFSSFPVEIMMQISILIIKLGIFPYQNVPVKIQEIIVKRDSHLEKVNNLRSMLGNIVDAGRLNNAEADRIRSILNTFASGVLSTDWNIAVDEAYFQLTKISMDLLNGFHVPNEIIEAFRTLSSDNGQALGLYLKEFNPNR